MSTLEATVYVIALVHREWNIAWNTHLFLQLKALSTDEMSWKFIIFLFWYLMNLLSVFARRGGSGTNIHHYPSYPHSYPHQPQTHLSQAHGYPHATQSHNYPHTPGLSGNSHSQGYRYNQRTEIHHHYHYSPPQHISYGSAQHPVFQGQPPTYVYQYRDSGSRFDTLLTGLALYNLGRMSSNHDHYRDNNYHREYRGNPGEICKLVIDKTNGEYEETRIDCKLMSSFIWDAESKHEVQRNNIVTKTVSVVQNVTRDGNITVINIQNTTVVDALQVKGPSIVVKPEMACYMIRISRDSSQLKRKVDCSLLQEYATKSLRYYNGCSRILSMTVLISVLITFILW